MRWPYCSLRNNQRLSLYITFCPLPQIRGRGQISAMHKNLYAAAQQELLKFVAPLGATLFSCLGKKRAKRSRHKGHCASRSRAPNPSPYVSPAALLTVRSTLTYILSTAKMFRFLSCRGSASGIRQGGESGAVAISKTATMCRHVVRTSRGFSVRAGRVHRGGRNLSRGSAA